MAVPENDVMTKASPSSGTSSWATCGAQFGEEFGELLFSILTVDEQSPLHH